VSAIDAAAKVVPSFPRPGLDTTQTRNPPRLLPVLRLWRSKLMKTGEYKIQWGEAPKNDRPILLDLWGFG
jgi:hypothetical protein